MSALTEDTSVLFMQHLRGLSRSNRGELAEIRRGLGSAKTNPAVLRHVVPYLVSRSPKRRQTEFERLVLLASLFSTHDEAGGRGNLGVACARSASKRGATASERRFERIISADAAGLARVLPRAVSILKADGVPVDWERLARDLERWELPTKQVQREWAEGFWAMASKDGGQ